MRSNEKESRPPLRTGLPMSESTDYNNTMPVGYYLGGLCYFIFFVVVGSYLFFRMPFL
jgi:hypothetical protein